MTNPTPLQELENRVDRMDAEFSRRTNILLDEMIVLTEEVSQLTKKVDQLTDRVDRLTDRVDQLAINQREIQVTVAGLAGIMARSIEAAERDRAEIVRIWQYLLGQQSNGHGAGL